MDPSGLAPKAGMHFTWAMYELFGAFDFIFLASKTNAIPAEVWQRWSSAVAWWLSFYGVQIWWAVRLIPIAESFTTYVESLIKNNPTDAETTPQYQDFAAQGKNQT